MQALFRREPEFPTNGRSYVAHNVMVYRPFLTEMLREIDAQRSPGAPSAPAGLNWPWRILATVQPGYKNVLVGFSEFTTYVSWVKQRYPDTLAEMSHKDWGRITPRKATREALYADNCCPTAKFLHLVAMKRTWAYLGWELGHSTECGEVGTSSARPLDMHRL